MTRCGRTPCREIFRRSGSPRLQLSLSRSVATVSSKTSSRKRGRASKGGSDATDAAMEEDDPGAATVEVARVAAPEPLDNGSLESDRKTCLGNYETSSKDAF